MKLLNFIYIKNWGKVKLIFYFLKGVTTPQMQLGDIWNVVKHIFMAV